MKYAENTKVPVERSRAEIERLLRGYGAEGFTSGWDKSNGISAVLFRYRDKMVRFEVQIPDVRDPEVNKAYKKGRNTFEYYLIQEERRRWRALVLAIKAKLELVSSGIVAFEEEFLPYIVVGEGGLTVKDWLLPKLAEGGALPALPSETTNGQRR